MKKIKTISLVKFTLFMKLLKWRVKNKTKNTTKIKTINNNNSK